MIMHIIMWIYLKYLNSHWHLKSKFWKLSKQEATIDHFTSYFDPEFGITNDKYRQRKERDLN